jgi:hypothetical protein
MNDDMRPTTDPRTRLDQLRRRKDDEQEILPLEEEEQGLEPAEDDGRCYSTVSADRIWKPMLVLRFINGDAKARSYSYLVGIDWDASAAIVIDFSGSTVTIEGRNLRPIFDGLCAHRVSWVREIDDLQARANLPKEAPVVTKIEVTEN